jgi:hypothetical protein
MSVSTQPSADSSQPDAPCCSSPTAGRALATCGRATAPNPTETPQIVHYNLLVVDFIYRVQYTSLSRAC